MAEKQFALRADEITVEKIFSQMDDIFQAANGNMDRFIVGMTLEIPKQELGDAVGKLFDMTCRVIRESDGGIETEQIFNYRIEEEGYKVREFLDFYKGYVDKKLRPFWDVKELRHMKLDEFKELVEFALFNHVLLLTERESDLSEDIIKAIKRVLNMCFSFVIIYRMGESMFCSEIHDIFYFGKEKENFLYSLIKENWQDVYQYEVTRRLVDISYEIRRLKDSL